MIYCEFWDINLRTKHENRPDQFFEIKEVSSEKKIYEDKNVKVECITVPHGEAVPSYGTNFM